MTTTGEREKRCVDVCECREEVFDQTRGRGRARARVCVCVDECLCVFVSTCFMCVVTIHTFSASFITSKRIEP